MVRTSLPLYLYHYSFRYSLPSPIFKLKLWLAAHFLVVWHGLCKGICAGSDVYAAHVRKPAFSEPNVAGRPCSSGLRQRLLHPPK